MRKLFIAMDIECENSQTSIADQIKATKADLIEKKRIESVNHDVVKPADSRYLIDDGKASASRFVFYLYRRIIGMIENGNIFVSESEQNKRLEDDLIPIGAWNQEKQALIEKTGLERLTTPITETLKELENRFHTQLDRVTANINADANDFVKCQPRSNRLTWSLANQRWKPSLDNPVYSQVKHIGIIEIMNYVSQKTGYLSAFEGVASRKKNTSARNEDLIACIFGNGANYGLYRIASASDRSIGALRAVNENYIRPETTCIANDIISNAIANLPIFKYYTINENAPFGSIDGQKHACRVNIFTLLSGLSFPITT